VLVPPVPGAVSVTVVGVVEPALVLVLLVAAPDAPDPLSPPHPASAIAVLPNNVNQTKRPTRSAFRMQYPENDFSPGPAGHEVTIRGLHERAA
jgi:hypothetical protein